MSRIRVDPEQLRDAAHQVAQASTRLNESRSHLARGWGRLNASGWYGGHRARVEGRWGGCQSQIATVAGQLSTLSQWLHESASVIEEADRSGVQALERVQSVFRELQTSWQQGLGAVYPFLLPELTRQLRLGSLLAEEALGYLKEHLGWLNPFAVAGLFGKGLLRVRTGTSYPGQVIFYGKHMFKDFAGLREHLTHSKVATIPGHMAKVAAAFDAVLTAIQLAKIWHQDYQQYKDQGAIKVVSVGAVDSVLKALLPVGTRYVGTYAGAKIGVIIGGLVGGGPVGAAIGGVIGGVAGNLAGTWLAERAAKWREPAIEWTSQAIESGVNLVQDAAQQVDSALRSVANAVWNAPPLERLFAW